MKSLIPLSLLSLAARTHAFGLKEPTSALLTKYASDIAKLKEEAQAVVGDISTAPYNNDVFYLRYCLDDKGTDALKENLAWRLGEGKEICASALAAFEKATEVPDKWDNDAVRDAAPFGSSINKYITPSGCLITSTTQGDMLYIVRAGKINDAEMMSVVSVENMVDFLAYGKEVVSLVANDRSLKTDKVVYLITVNDLKGLDIIGGDDTFRKALSASSKQATKLYPGLKGPTLIFNLPRLLSQLVKIFTPLFPKEVAARLKFERGPLEKVEELVDVNYGGKFREEFMDDVNRLCY